MTVIAYAQVVDGRQGVDVALDGVATTSDERTFAQLRERATELNFSGREAPVPGAKVRYGHGLIRVEFFDGTTDTGGNPAPVVVVASAEDVRTDLRSAVRRAVGSVEAIGRRADAALIEHAFTQGAHADASFRRTRVFAIAAITLATLALIAWAIGRSGASLDGFGR